MAILYEKVIVNYSNNETELLKKLTVDKKSGIFEVQKHDKLSSGPKKVITRTKIDMATGEVVEQDVTTFAKVRGERFIMLQICNDEWDLAFTKLTGSALFMLMFLVTHGFVNFGNGSISFDKYYREQMRAMGLDMADQGIWRNVKNLEECGILLKASKSVKILNQKFFNNGKATTWYKQ